MNYVLVGHTDMKLTVNQYGYYLLSVMSMFWTKFHESMKEKLGEDHILGKGKSIRHFRQNSR